MTYRKSFTYSRPSGVITDYQVKILVGESSGSTGYDVHCEGHCLSTFYDLRFTNASGTALDYCFEHISGTTPNQVATVWVKLDSIGTSSTTFYMIYGNAEAVDESSGDDTFIFFDDFEYGSVGDDISLYGKWSQEVATNNVTIGSRYYYGTRSARFYSWDTASPVISAPLTISDNQAIRFFCRTITGEEPYPKGIMCWNIDSSRNSPLPYVTYYNTDVECYYGSYTWHLVGTFSGIENWIKVELFNFNYSSNTYSVTFEDMTTGEIATVTGVTMRGLGKASWINKLVLQASFSVLKGNILVDMVSVRKWSSTEPTFGEWGSEEIIDADKDLVGLLKVSPLAIGRTAIDNYTPTKWFTWGNEIILEPVPDDAYTLSLYVSDYPSTVLSSDTDIPSGLPKEFHECIVLFVCYSLCLKLKKWSLAVNFYNQYLQSLENKYKIYMDRKVDEIQKKTMPDYVIRRR